MITTVPFVHQFPWTSIPEGHYGPADTTLPPPLFDLGLVVLTDGVFTALAESRMCLLDLFAYLEAHSAVQCGCNNEGCREHQMQHLFLGGTMTSCFYFGPREELALDPNVTTRLMWIHTLVGRERTQVAMASEMPWSTVEDPLEHVHENPDREQRVSGFFTIASKLGQGGCLE